MPAPDPIVAAIAAPKMKRGAYNRVQARAERP
jgi:hypothetical protein